VGQEAADGVVGTAGQIGQILGAAAAGAEPVFAGGSMPRSLVLPIVFLPLLGCVLAGVCAALRIRSRLPAWLSVACLGGAFLCAVALYARGSAPAGIAHAFEWINFQWGDAAARSLTANFSFYVDSLTLLWMLFVTGLATLIALYASEYMSHDLGAGYCRFYAAFNLFVFSMACLVMGDNLVLLYLGWEGVGLCSYLLIGYYYRRPSAVAAAKKAFIMNRIGDLGLALGVWLTFVKFGTVEYDRLFPMIEQYVAFAQAGEWHRIPLSVQWIPVLFTIGAFGKSAQVPLYVWLPDAMEGPTPVSALIHAATMVTAGVYLVARWFPLYSVSEFALPIVAWGGAVTALLAATIGMAQFDIKRIMAYSTVSQLGYMFCGLGVLGSVAGASHVFTHAFFKALLFLACGAVMHGFAGQLDLRKLSGLGRLPGWRIVSWTMLVGCINLAGVPVITSGFWSKDMILGDAFANPHTQAIAWILLLTAGLTAYYTFRVYFRVFVGPTQFEPGEEAHGAGHADHDEGHGHAPGHGPHGPSHGGHDFHPHAPGWAINLVLVVLAVACFAAIPLVAGHDTWTGRMVEASTARPVIEHAEHATFFGLDAHRAMQVVSGVVALLGIAVAFVLHRLGRTSAATSRADALVPLLGPIPAWARHKWYVDEFYHYAFVLPLRVVAYVCKYVDALLVDGLVNAFGWAPRGLGRSIRPAQTGLLHDYALRMISGVGLVLLIVLLVMGGRA
jgi:NADH-quinone oxidoreductase subunit L